MAINTTTKKTMKIIGFILPVVIIAVFFLVPVFTVLFKGVFDSEGLTFEYLAEVFSNGFYYKLFAFTISQALLSTIVTLLIGVPLGYVFGKYDFPARKLFLTIFTVPFVLPSVLVGMGFLNVFTEDGFLGSPMLSVVLAHAFYNIPLVIHYFDAFYQNFDRDLSAAAKTLKSRSLHTFLRIYLPIFLQPILTAALLTFNFSFLSFGIILLLGAPSRLRTIEVQIYSEYLPGEINIAAALAIMQLLVTVFYLIIFLIFMRKNKQQETTFETSDFPREKINLSERIKTGSGLFLIVIFVLGLVLELLPIFSIIIFSFLGPGASNLTIENYTNLFKPEIINYIQIPFYRTILNTLLFSLGSAFFALFLAIITVLALGRRTSKKSTLLYELLTYLPLAVSSITLSLGILNTFANVQFFTENPWIYIIILHGLLGYPFITRALLNGLNSINPEIEDATKTLGASLFYKIRKIYLPLLLPSILAGFVFALGLSIGEFTVTNIFYLNFESIETLTVALYVLRRGRHFGESNAVGGILLLFSYLAFFLIELVGRRKKNLSKMRFFGNVN